MNAITVDPAVIFTASKISRSERKMVREASGFTLLELIVCVAIIALLIALIFPMVSKITMNGLQAATSSDLRQIGIAMMSYASDHDGKLPGPSCGGIFNYGRAAPQDSDTPHMGAYIAPYLNASKDSTNPSRPPGDFPVNALKCPALKPVAQNDAYAANWYKWDYPTPSEDNIFGISIGTSSPGGLTFTGARTATPQPKCLAALTSKQLRTAVISTADLQVWNNQSYAAELPAKGVFNGKRLWLFLDGSQAFSTNAAIWQR